MNLESLKGWVGQKINGISLNIDLVNYCCLKCPSCAVGSIGGRETGTMSLALFKRILDKVEAEEKIRWVQLYAYSDPCLHPDLDKFVADCTQRGVNTHISTMLQTTKCDFRKVIEARPTEFRISMPGWDKMAYYQKGAKRESFDRKFWDIVKLPRYPETTWTMAFHLYNDNENEVAHARRWAEGCGIKFVVLPAIFMPCEKVVMKNYTKQDNELISHLIETPEESVSRMKLSNYCTCWKQITVDAQGRVFLCQLVYEDRFIIGNFMDMTVKETLAKIKGHSFCSACLKAGGNVYQECFADFVASEDPIGEANRKRLK